MIIRGTPKNVMDYILVNSKVTKELHKNGFTPRYINNNGVYFLKTKELIEFMERRKN